MGVRKDGTSTALEHALYWDAGAYVEYGANVVNAAGLSATGPYRVPNLKIDSVCIYTNLPPGGPYRGFGYSEFIFGLESHITRLAHQIGMDPVALRKCNAIEEGDTLPYGATMNPSGLQEAIDKAAAAIAWGKKEKSTAANKEIGKGFALMWKAPAMPPNAASAAFLKFSEDGSINITVSGMEIGQGYLTVMAQIAAEILSVPTEKIRVETPDTDRNPYEWQNVGSHVTWGCGNAVRDAACEARDKIFSVVHRAHGLPPETLYLENEQVRCRAQPEYKLPLRDFVISGIQMEDGTFRGGPIQGSGMFMPEFTSAFSDPETSQGGHPNVHYTVGAAGVVLEMPLTGDRQGTMFAFEGEMELPEGEQRGTNFTFITPGYFEAMQVPLLRGRLFDETDDGRNEAVIIINQRFADAYFPDRDPIGQRLHVGFNFEVVRRIVGIVGDTRHSTLTDVINPGVYAPYYQVPWGGTLSLAVRSTLPAESVVSSVRGEILDTDPVIRVYDASTVRQILSDSVARPRFTALLVALFALMALLLAAVGIYGVIRYNVGRRLQEIGVRIALGADRGAIVRMILNRGLLLVGIGVLAGLGASLLLTGLLRSQLYGVAPTDLVTFLAVAMILCAVAGLASYLPAHRATRVDPVRALRQE